MLEAGWQGRTPGWEPGPHAKEAGPQGAVLKWGAAPRGGWACRARARKAASPSGDRQQRLSVNQCEPRSAPRAGAHNLGSWVARGPAIRVESRAESQLRAEGRLQ